MKGKPRTKKVYTDLEFDCEVCGRHLKQLTGDGSHICGACQVIPGWHKNPELRKLLIHDGSKDWDT